MIRRNTWERDHRDGWFKLYDGEGRVLAKLRHDLDRAVYVDGEGNPLSRDYVEAKAKAAKGVKHGK